MVGKIKGIFARIRTQGVRAVLKKLFHDHIYSVDHVLLLTRALDEDYPLKRVTLSNMQAVFSSSPKDCAPLLAAYPDRRKYFETYLEKGCTAAFAVRGDQVVAYVWVATKDFYDAFLYRYDFKIQDKQIYQFAGYVEPAFRGKPVSLALMNLVNAYFAERGYNSTLAAVSTSNEVSMRFHAKLKYRVTEQAFDSVKFLAWRWSRPALPSEAKKRFPKADVVRAQ